MAFLDNVLQLCERNGEKLTPLMKQLNLSPGNVQRWRDGATVNSDILMKFSEHFGVSVDFLLTGHEFVNPDNPPPLSEEESEMVKMYRTVPDSAKEFFYDSLRAAYDREIVRQNAEKTLLA